MQLPSYNYAKSKLVSSGLMSDSSYWTYLVSSSFSGICVVSLACEKFNLYRLQVADSWYYDDSV